MSDDIEKLNAIFRTHDENRNGTDTEQTDTGGRRGEGGRRLPKSMDELLIDSSGQQRNYTGDEETERDYRPVRQSHEYKSGCLGGIMYFAFVICVSVVLACLVWMGASEMLALNKEDFTAVVTLPTSIFRSETVDTFDDAGKKTGTKRITHADIGYVADALKDAGLIEYKWLFETFCKISKAETKVSPGEYELKSSFDYRALIQNMRSGSSSTVTVKVTLPEGFRMRQIFRRLEEQNVCTFEELMDAAANYSFNYDFLDENELGRAERLEGFLFPDTYEFYVGMQASSAINKLLETFNRKLTAEMRAQAESLGLNIRDIVNIASLIEKEAANDTERPVISSVIYNRLNAGGSLGLDSAILYPYPDHEGEPTAEMIAADDPYNTRIYSGLPPTPICCPGLPSINAALYPQHTDYYYFYLDPETGEHQFFVYETEFINFVNSQNHS